jgi:hypothetical protein
MAGTPVTLQINPAPRDFRFARHLQAPRGRYDLNGSMREDAA